MKTTKKQFKEFDKYCRKFIKLWGLDSWNVYIIHEGIPDSILAQVVAQPECMTATITFNTDPYDEEIDIEETAFHECVHILIRELEWIGECRYIGPNETTRACESLVNKITKVVLPLTKGKR